MRKVAMLTDVHFGKKSNSFEHNQDCLDYLEWFCGRVKSDPAIDSIAFLGDWYENRSAINIATLEYSYRGAKMLNDLDLPIYFTVGNHDLHKRHTREIHATNVFNEMSNFVVIDKPTVIEGVLFCPFIFDHEYPELVQYTDAKWWAGHFEFKGFAITGYNTIMEHGPDHTMFKKVKRIFSGHFHKRQVKDNVAFIGNTFPMDYGDAGDNDRGMAVYVPETDDLTFTNWGQAPKYKRVVLSEVLDGKGDFAAKMRVTCTVDTVITYTEAQAIRETMIESYQLREFALLENRQLKRELLEEDNSDGMVFDDLTSVDELVAQSLSTIDAGVGSGIDQALLVKIYQETRTE